MGNRTIAEYDRADPPRRRPLKTFWKKVRGPLAETRAVKSGLAGTIAMLLRGVKATNRLVPGSQDPATVIGAHQPAIIALWHGQHLLAPAYLPDGLDVVALFSRSRDAELNALVAEVADLHRVQEAAVQIEVDADPHIDQVEADRGRVRQILNNLIVNAVEAVEHSPSGRVMVATRLESAAGADYATITVSDNGPGFTREVLGRVFDPYVTSKPKGTGLGLAIVKKIVEEHGGRVEADNRPEGGARVRVSLPVTDGTRQTVARERRAEPRKERA